MSFLPPEPRDPKKPTSTRIFLWIAVAGIGIYSIVQGVIGLIHRG